MRAVSIALFSFTGWLLCFCQPHVASDTLNPGEKITANETLVSNGGKFELGFFSPRQGSTKYLGIWYNESQVQPRTVVWVANRDNPVPDSTASFQIADDGNLRVSDSNGKDYWSSGLEGSSSLDRTVKLMDSGNLVLTDDEVRMNNLWQSFEHPTDTFLPSMKMDKNMNLTSWRSSDDPAPGNYTFQLAQTGDNSYRILKDQVRLHWQSSDEIPATMPNLLTNVTRSPACNVTRQHKLKNSKTLPVLNSTNPVYDCERLVMNSKNPVYKLERLVMNYTGKIEFQRYINDTDVGEWSTRFSKPETKCRIHNYCGSFRSCNDQNRPVCKCLPGFDSLPARYSSGEQDNGCFRKSTWCGRRREDITFLNLTMVEVGGSGKQVFLQAKNEAECQAQCLNCSNQCQAYSFTVRISDRNPACFIWTQDLLALNEDSPQNGISLSIPLLISDIALTAKTCKPCGTTIIPYPLSTGPDCGDPSYFKLNCINTTKTGQVSFNLSGVGFLRVSKIDPDNRKLRIQTNNNESINFCDNQDQRQQVKVDLPFNVTDWCSAEDEIEVSWLPPLEPLCHNSTDCNDWPHSTCNNNSRDGKRRCLCDANYYWNNSNLTCIVRVTLSSAAFVACIVVAAYIWKSKIAHKKDMGRVQRVRGRMYDSERQVKDLIDLQELEEDDNEGIEVPYYDFETILAATDNFSDANKLGRGGYGPVYKGILPGEHHIAVKRLSNVSSQGLKEFKNEVVLISKLQHRNLVRLRGYCITGDEKILLYEYMPNKSLDAFLFDPTQSVILDWQMRFDIILGVVRGMLYLHQDSRLRVIHRDLKTSNILLDEEMQPKISDFGLARIFGSKEIEANTERIVGTYGYMAPEYALDGLFSIKSDIFSFGVVVLEIITGKKNTGFFQSKQVPSLLGYAWKLWTENKLLDLMDQSLGESCNVSQFIKCAQVSLLCVQDEPGDRPTMSQVLIMLESETASLPTPKQPTFFMSRDRGISSTASSSSKPEGILSTQNTYQEGR
ncbi:G-type lectin S-receptor-like serine/threonine-protein kinase At4g03230 isoform X2 [Prosopis cineraria]|uniref:G-type lectin S-receptor-like serine/threonine-protein kinase At4g03230 isoform X2 n=1 Tax=Prosopis cineraria TaxID=364024 RepID=UPI0024101585|nr:G-type lectin S-receptor-like serine/threonine-protein kinase At4g03230 isoform X2 [Prosopis cineraria]